MIREPFLTISPPLPSRLHFPLLICRLPNDNFIAQIGCWHARLSWQQDFRKWAGHPLSQRRRRPQRTTISMMRLRGGAQKQSTPSLDDASKGLASVFSGASWSPQSTVSHRQQCHTTTRRPIDVGPEPHHPGTVDTLVKHRLFAWQLDGRSCSDKTSGSPGLAHRADIPITFMNHRVAGCTKGVRWVFRPSTGHAQPTNIT